MQTAIWSGRRRHNPRPLTGNYVFDDRLRRLSAEGKHWKTEMSKRDRLFLENTWGQAARIGSFLLSPHSPGFRLKGKVYYKLQKQQGVYRVGKKPCCFVVHVCLWIAYFTSIFHRLSESLLDSRRLFEILIDSLRLSEILSWWRNFLT